MATTNCELCVNYVFDDDCEDYVCLAQMDEDDYMKFITQSNDNCPFFRLDDEYKIVRKQN